MESVFKPDRFLSAISGRIAALALITITAACSFSIDASSGTADATAAEETRPAAREIEASI